MLGENGIGETKFFRSWKSSHLCFISPLFWLEFEGIKLVSSCRGCMPEFNVSYKPQGYDWKRECTALRQLLHDAYKHP
ncbi:unnamed protein product [Brassica oleracea]